MKYSPKDSTPKIPNSPPPHPSFRSNRLCSPPLFKQKRLQTPTSPPISLRRESTFEGQNSLNQKMLDVLKTQNSNLKEQNEYLIDKLRLGKESEDYYKEKCLKYTGIVSELKNHNVHLQEQMRKLRDLVNSQIARLSAKENLLTRAKSANEIRKEEVDDPFMFDIEELNPEFSKGQISTEALSDKPLKQESKTFRKLIERTGGLRLRKKRTQ